MRALKVRAPAGPVSALLERPRGAWALYVLAHGAGAGMRHHFLERFTKALAARGVATLRYQFPYAEAGSKRPDRAPVLEATTRAAVERGRKLGLPLFAGGKSMGGRMTSRAAAEAPLEGVRGLALLGFPLHAAGKPPSVERAAHLEGVRVPMLFLQGDRDALAELERLVPVCERLGRRATLHVVAGADHGFDVLKRSGRTADDVLAELADAFVAWARPLA